MSKASKYIWGIVGNVLPQMLHLLGTVILARILTPEDFGMVGVLGVFIAIANVLIDTGLGGSLVKEKCLSKSDCAAVSVFNMGVSVLLYMSIYLAAPYIEQFYQLEGLTTITRSFSIVFIVSAFGLVPRSLLVRDLKFKQLGILSIVAVIISSVCAIGAAISGWNAYALVLYQVLNAFISTMGCIILSKYTFSVRFRKSAFLKHFSFGFYTTLANIIDAIYDNILVVITGKISTVDQVGYMSQSKKIQDVSTSGISLSINNVAFPLLTKYRDEKESFVRESNQLLSTVSLLLFPILVLISIFAKQVILIVFGEQWIDATPYLSALMVAGIFVILERLIRNYIKSLLLVKELLKITILQRLVGLAIIVGLTISSHKLLIISYVFASIIVWLISSLKYTQLIDISFKQFLAEQCRAIVPSLLFFVILRILSYAMNNIVIMFAITVVLMTVYYFVVLPQCYSISIKNIVKSLLTN